jgi:hypothetical protein
MLAAAALLAAGTASGGGPNVYVVDAPFYEDGTNCATGEPADIYGVFTGVVHEKLLANGSYQFHVAARGSSTLYPDGSDPNTTAPVGQAEFNNTVNYKVLPNGGVRDKFTLQGVLTTATGEHRFHVVIVMVIAPGGTVQVDHLRFDCA